MNRSAEELNDRLSHNKSGSLESISNIMEVINESTAKNTLYTSSKGEQFATSQNPLTSRDGP